MTLPEKQSEQTRSAYGSAAETPTAARADKLIPCPFTVFVDGQVRDQFYDARDAVAAARAIRKQNPAFDVVVTDTRTGRLKIEIER